MTLSNSGVSRYHAFEATLRLQPLRQTDLNLSYIWSRNRGDLNTSSEIFVPFEQPVIRPDAFSIASSDVPHRFVAWGGPPAVEDDSKSCDGHPHGHGLIERGRAAELCWEA
jgi:hypothetical protein